MSPSIRLVDDGDTHVVKTHVTPLDEILEPAGQAQDINAFTQRRSCGP